MNISLIGMMGSGKTTIAKLLVRMFSGYCVVDMDSLIVDREKTSINEIFSVKGENYFRDIESKILFEVLKNDNQIISTGGGIVKKEENISLLKENSVVVYLETSSKVLFDRVQGNNERPLLNVSNMKEKIENILNERISLYKKAHIVVNTDEKEPDNIVDEIMNELKNYVAN